MLRLYGPLAARIEVVHLGVGPEFRPGIRFPRPLPDEFVLFLGNRANYKDFPVAAEAFAMLADAHPGLRLVAAGGGRFVKAEEELLERLRITDRVDRVTATDEELPGLFAAARAFVFPSRYEGFGLPTLEAMASGTAVVLADSSSHPEVGGDAALYFAPGDPAALADRLASILDEPALRERLVQAGLARAATFTWRRTAERTRDVYEAVLAGR
jgi:glycosyltransferase involved in cell wall biosynthesis